MLLFIENKNKCREVEQRCQQNLLIYRASVKRGDINMENNIAIYQSIIAEVKEIISAGRGAARRIQTQYYYRLLQSPKKENIIEEMKAKTNKFSKSRFELLKSPIVAEFLGFKNENTYLESDLESAILSHIRDFLMEMGKGFAFVGRQQHIITDTQDYYIDLVFYNIELKCYVLVDLKMGTITYHTSTEYLVENEPQKSA